MWSAAYKPASPFGALRTHPHYGFVKNIATLFTGKTLAFAVGLAAIPFISRLFTPADFGVAALFISMSSILASVAALGYERAVVLPAHGARGGLLVWLGSGLLAVLSAAALFAVAGLLLLGVDLASSLGRWVWLVPLGMLLLGAVNVFEGWLVRTKHYKTIAYADVTQSLVAGGGRIGCGALFGSSVSGLVGGYFGGVIFKLLLLWKPTRSAFGLGRAPRLWQALKGVAREYKDFPLYNAPSALVRSLSQNLPILLFGYLFSPAIVGFYAMAERIVRAPLNVAGMAVRRVYIQRAAEIRNAGRTLRSSFGKATAALALLGVGPCFALWFFGESVFVVLLGSEWSVAGGYAAIMAPWLYAIWVTTPSATLLVVLRKQRVWFQFQSALLVARLGVFLVALIGSASPATTLSAFVAVSVAAHVIIVLMVSVIVCREGVAYGKTDRLEEAARPAGP